MPHAVILRRLLLLTLLFLPQRFWLGKGWRLTARLRPRSLRSLARATLVMAALGMIAVLTDRILRKFLPSPLSRSIAPIVQLWIFSSTVSFFCLKLVVLLRCIADWTVARHQHRRSLPADQGRRSVLRQTALLAGGAPFAGAFYGYAFERLNFEIVRTDISLARLPKALDGLRLLHISDIHVGDFMPPSQIRRAIGLANELRPHLAVITGDFLTSAGDPLGECIAALSGLRADLGIWGCNGNHEIYAGAEDWAELLFRRHDMTLLRQSAAVLQWKGAALNLMGVDYQHDVQLTGSAHPRLNGVDTLIRDDLPNILLSHNPNTFYRAAELGIDLSLAGHTHGGQVNVEILHHGWNPARFMTPFVAGLYRLPTAMPRTGLNTSNRSSCLYVNRGLGTLGVPARLGAQPEITLLTLRSAPGL